jgi:hypothetical protein
MGRAPGLEEVAPVVSDLSGGRKPWSHGRVFRQNPKLPSTSLRKTLVELWASCIEPSKTVLKRGVKV